MTQMIWYQALINNIYALVLFDSMLRIPLRTLNLQWNLLISLIKWIY